MFLFLSLFASCTFRPDHAVSLGVIAPWYGVPLFEQILFFLSDYSDFTTTNFLTAVLQNGYADNETHIWSTVQSLLPSSMYSLLKSEVELGYYLPRAEMYRETARNFCGSKLQDLFFVLKDNSTESEKQFEKYSIPQLPGTTLPFDFDLVFNEGSSFVYANLHNSTSAQVVLNLINDEVPFILRPIAQTDQYGIPIRGFGIEMRPFRYSMEYGVKDSIVLDQVSKQNSTFVDETTKLIQGIPESYVNLTNITDFGAKFSGFIGSHSDVPLPKLMRDVTNNFPAFMHEIINSKPNQTAYNYVHNLIKPGTTFSSLNGRQIQLNYMDVFTLLDIINEEKNVRSILESEFNIEQRLVDRLISTELNDDHSVYLDYEKANVTFYINDLEKDPEYQSWSSDVRAIFTSASFPQIRKNLINLVFIGDPSTYGGFNTLTQINSMRERGLGIRIGMIPHFSLGNRLSRKVGYAFYHLALNYGEQVAVTFITETIKHIGINMKTYYLNQIKEDHFMSSYEEILKTLPEIEGVQLLHWNELHNLFDDQSRETKEIKRVNQFIYDNNFERNTILSNGKHVILSGGYQSLMYDVHYSMRMIAQIISEHRIYDLSNETALSLLRRSCLVVSSFENEVIYENPTTTDITHKTLSQQLAFLKSMKNVEYKCADSGKAAAFYILFTENETEIEEFKKFAESSKDHIVPSMFDVNPTVFSDHVLESFNLKKGANDRNLLFVNGRIYKNIDITFKKLKVIDEWTSYHISSDLNKSISTIKYKRLDVMTYLSLVQMNWLSEKVRRSRFHDSWNDIKLTNVYSSVVEDGRLTWEVFADPFTREFQRIASIIDYLKDVINIRLIIVPPNELTDPIQSYYRMALENDQAVFSMLNDTTTYSSLPDMPDSWIFESLKASVDLDNILLSELSASIHQGTYILTNIKTEGVCISDDDYYAEGAELALFDVDGNKKSDTIVMRSNGYWQLAANPGIWNVDLGGQKSKSIYSMITKKLIVSGFGQKSHILQVAVNPGMEGIKVYNLSVTPTTNTTRVDVFSVASGHLYERLLKIMMVAVRKRSQYNVKFWIIKMFLSPQFKATLPIMAKKYNFTYELVSYKWPKWLRPQYEKQRIIWGNKILFLDVLFPLDLERVIYIDSDQIVRTDLVELMRMDFGDAPYAFTPFCESRKETEPFRFWKQGYWKDRLGDKWKYHISALFAIDLRRFRQMAAGDILRMDYQMLSSDPSSLSNLDQDLPNYAQDQIPIFSLPQNWLWCETWCSDDSLDAAKTIDLCNNPLTKKPKLYVAQTMVKEWPGLDQEVRDISAGPEEYEKFFFPQQ